MPASVTVITDEDIRRNGYRTRGEALAENATGNFVKVVQRIPVKILVDSPGDLILRPGMNVDATRP